MTPITGAGVGRPKKYRAKTYDKHSDTVKESREIYFKKGATLSERTEALDMSPFGDMRPSVGGRDKGFAKAG